MFFLYTYIYELKFCECFAFSLFPKHGVYLLCNNLSTEEDGHCTKFQKLDVQSNVQLTPTSVLKENKRAYSGTTTKQQRKKIQKTL